MEPPIAHPAHHVEVEHGDGALHGHGGMARVVGGAEEPHLLAGEEREDQRARRRAGRREGSREPEDDGGAGRIVVGAGMDEAAGAPEVVVVSAQDHRLRRARRIGARQDADDVAGVPILALEVDADARPDARGERRREPGVRQRSAELGGGLRRRLQQPVGRGAGDRRGDETNGRGGGAERRERIARDQEGARAMPARGDELLEP